MRQKHQRLFKKGKGITLITLVITIIILVLLAGISITTLTNQGLFGQTLTAKNLTEQKTAEENETLQNYLEQINAITSGQTPATPEKLTDTENTKPSQAMPKNSTIIEKDYSKGIVIADSAENEWTWVEVPKTIFTTATKADDYENIKTDLITYASTYRNGNSNQTWNWTDEWYNGCGITDSATYTIMYNKMLSSVYTNGGFWISRYEIGDSTTTTNNTTRTSSSGTVGNAVSKPNQIPYNYIACSEAQNLASQMSTDESKTSSLLFGIQWDLVCKYLEVNGSWDTSTNLASYYINTNSSSWGNYSNSSLKLSRGKYLIDGNEANTWTEYNVDTTNYITNSQTSDNTRFFQMLTTGASEQTNKMNIYDFAGNLKEWTLEHATTNGSYPYGMRGGYYQDGGYSNISHQASSKSHTYSVYGTNVSNIFNETGFRVTQY